jgi:hypothetical protein
VMNQSLENLFHKALEPQIGDFANGVLYSLCKNYFEHKEAEVVLAKIWLIGRAYAAAIERRRTLLEIPNDEFYELISHWFVKSKLDELLESMKGGNPNFEQNVPEILTLHKYVVDWVRQKTGLDKRSFASKYLHFHLPDLFFIYDSRAAGSLQKLAKEIRIGTSDKQRGIALPEKVDRPYAEFFLRAWVVKSALETRFGQKMTIRQLDNLLIEMANQDLKQATIEA